MRPTLAFDDRSVAMASFESEGVLSAMFNANLHGTNKTGAFLVTDGNRTTAALLLVLTSLAFLIPAHASLGLGRRWHGTVFATVAIVCCFYHVCDTELLEDLGLCGSCPAEVRRGLTLADHGLAYFGILQMGFLVLGPEDPTMQWIDHPLMQGTMMLESNAPLDVMLWIRVLPVTAMLCFLSHYSSWEDFHWECIIMIEAILLVGCCTFWLHQDRRSSLPKIVTRQRFWQRIFETFLVPGVLLAAVFVGMESADSRAVHSLWHIITASLALRIIRTVSSRGEAQVQDLCASVPQNPLVTKLLLCMPAILGLSTLLGSAAVDTLAAGHWRWPMVTMPSQQRPGGFLVVLGAMPSLLAMSGAFWLIHSTAGPNVEADIALSTQLGCHIGYCSMGFGLAAVAAHGAVFPVAHLFCLVAFLLLLLLAMTLTTLSVRYPLASGCRLRCSITVASIIAATGFLMLLLLAKQFVPNPYDIPHELLAVSEYLALAIPTLWPLTWSEQVLSRWQSPHKYWRSSSRADEVHSWVQHGGQVK